MIVSVLTPARSPSDVTGAAVANPLLPRQLLLHPDECALTSALTNAIGTTVEEILEPHRLAPLTQTKAYVPAPSCMSLRGL